MTVREAVSVNLPSAASPSRGEASAPDAWSERLLAAVEGKDTRRVAEALALNAPASYRERTTAAEAALDVVELDALAKAESVGTDSGLRGRHRFVVRPDRAGVFRLRRFADQPVELTALLPLLESFGFVVESSVPYQISLGPDDGACIDDIAVHLRAGAGGTTTSFDAENDGPRLVRALDAVVRGSADVDQLNGLVATACLEWREVALLRAYSHYGAQLAPPNLSADLETSLLTFPSVARSLVGYFRARFSPGANEPEATARAACVTELGRVQLLRWDRALRMHLGLVDATLRTNFFQVDEHGAHPGAVVLKLDSPRVPLIPPPPPFVETWVHAPEVEAVHLRGGLVARGGIRWSQRSDFRTEVLDLMVAQVKKNAVIVPTGAKGGFLCRRTASPSPESIREAYVIFIGSLLDITDNVVKGEVVTPQGVVARDLEDPYLVVAADKGTAELSDVANEISAARGFWLGDAFASGGSHGYNHKEIGITARGAWVAVRRHFHQLGIDVQTESISVAGVGDMSGDVFGNGMLMSDAIRLVAAFDHRHIFIDPDPDPSTSFAERRRLAWMPRSSWADYSAAAISEGGGVWPRQVKSIPLSGAAQRALGVSADRLAPPELIAVILEAPVDLLWFGGIGTFIRAADENDTGVGDQDNDEVRTTADRVRARVIAEGANLGITQRGRIRYSRRGGRINTDFIDNAAGVAISDREVNLKILLASAAAGDRLAAGERDAYLSRAQYEVVDDVLRLVDQSVAALNRAVPQSAQQLDAYAALIDVLEASGLLDRSVEALPDASEIDVRREAGAGMIRPELAVLLAYAKSDLARAIDSAPFVRDPSLTPSVSAYFPVELRAAFPDLVVRHRLYARILAAGLASEVVDRLGIVWAHESAAELGCSLADAAACYWAAREVIGAGPLWAELDGLWSTLPADAEVRLHDIMSGAVARVARRYLRLAPPPAPADLVAVDMPLADAIDAEPPLDESLQELVMAGVDEGLAARWLRAAARSVAVDVGPIVRATGADAVTASGALAEADRAAATARMRAAVLAEPGGDRWRSWLARAVLDDLDDWRIEAARAVVAWGKAAAPATTWAAAHAPQLTAARRVLAALDRPGADALAVVAVALRRLPRGAGAVRTTSD